MLFSMPSESRCVKWIRFFDWNCIVKWVIFFASFCWLWDFLLENLKLKRSSEEVLWNIWANIKRLYARNNSSKYNILNHLYFRPIVYFGDCFRAFSQVFFFYISSLANRGGRHFYSAPPPSLPPTVKELHTALI